MSEQFIYQSVFAPYFKDFLAMKESQVSDIGRIKWMLLEFDKFFVNSNIREIGRASCRERVSVQV